VIPASVREHMGIHPGEKMAVFEKNGTIQLVRFAPVKNLRGMLKGVKVEGIRDERDRY